jgi:hypothetical protein
METQASFSALCGGPCTDVRYIFYLRNAASDGDATTVRDGTARGMGDTLFFDEERTTTKNVFRGDLNQPVLAFSVTAPSTNENVARVEGFEAVVDGATAADLVALSIFNDSAPFGSLDATDLATPPLGSAPMSDAGTAEIMLATPIVLAPGEQLSGLLTVDVAAGARAPSWFNVSIAREGSLFTLGGTKVLYEFFPEPSAVRILGATSGSRALNDLVINEVYTTAPRDGRIEIYDTTESSTTLNASGSQISVRTYTWDDPDETNVDFWDFPGSTNSSGFAVIDVDDMRHPSGGRTLRIELFCEDCSAGGGDNSTYIDIIEVPLNVEYWGRYPDGDSNVEETLPNTRGLPNAIPEFQDVVVPVLGIGIFFAVASRMRARGAASSRLWPR